MSWFTTIARRAALRPSGKVLSALALVASAAAPLAVSAADTPTNTAIDRLDRPADTLRTPKKASLQTLIENNDRLIAVGQRGVAIYSDDKGETWTQAPTPISVALTAVIARQDGVAIAVGHDAAIVRSADNGATWTKIVDGFELLPRMIKDMEQRYAAEKKIFDALPPEQQADRQFDLEDLEFRVDTMKQSMEFGPAWPFLDVLFMSDRPNEDRILALGAFGMAYLSEDAGLSWTLVNDRFDNPQDFHLNAGFVTKTGAVIVGSEAGMLFRSQDGAANFEAIETFDGFSFFGLNTVPGTDEIVAYGFGDTYHLSTDDGRSWTSSPISESLTLAGSVHLPSGDLGIVGEGGQMIVIGEEGEKRRFRPIDTRKVLGDALRVSDDKVIYVGEIGARIADSQ